MTLRPVAALAAVCTLSLITLPVVLCRADAPPLLSPVDAQPDVQAAPTASQAAPPAASIRFYHRRIPHASFHAYNHVRSLPSRGVDLRSDTAASAIGRLAVVTADKTAIVAGRDRAGRVLSVCPKGQYLAISGETPTEYAVLMIDHSLGYVAKSDVELLDYQVAPATTAGGDASAQTAEGATLGQRLVQTAQTYLGVPYVWGGDTAAGIDCSGFVRAVYSTYGITLPRVSRDQAAVGYDVPHNVAGGDWTQWVPGDRMYFACHHPEIDHTGMYIGGGLFIHASAGHGHQVAIDRVDNVYYSKHLVAVRRSQELLGEPVAPGDYRETASAADPEASQQ